MLKSLLSLLAGVSFMFISGSAEKDIGRLVFSEDFSKYVSLPDGAIICNEYATHNPLDKTAHRSPLWEQSSGTFYKIDSGGFSGLPDKVPKGALSSKESIPYNNSAVFRIVTKKDDLACNHVRLFLKNDGISGNDNWNGFHLMLRYQSPSDLIYVSVNRKDNVASIKRKIPDGGPSNKGTYFTLADIRYEWPKNRWQRIEVDLVDNPDNSVTANLKINNKLILSGTDQGQRSKINGRVYAPLNEKGKFGFRGDWTKFEVKDIRVYDE